MATNDPFANFAITTVSGAPSPATTGTSVTLTDATNFPDPASVGPYNVVIWATGAQPLSSNAEIVRVTAKAGSVLTITRQQEGTSARTVVVGDNIAMAPTKATLESIGAWATWTPTLAQAGGVTYTATFTRYCQIGKTVHISIVLTVTGTGNAGAQVQVSTPVTPASNQRVVGQGFLFDSSAGALYSCHVDLNASITIILRQIDAPGTLGVNGFTDALGNGDIVSLQATYEAA